mmetsp:Transcript_27968/g.51666  ORF Transcript_27968/g.51666 Transcript_27968/m.51666 type:complete len:102 (-) Transcript_27968:269-574(-)
MAQEESAVVSSPLDLLKLSLDERIYVKLKGNREMRGKLHAFDQHSNLLLGDVEEILTTIDTDEETMEEIIKTHKRAFPCLFVRGDHVILISPPFRLFEKKM